MEGPKLPGLGHSVGVAGVPVAAGHANWALWSECADGELQDGEGL